MQFKYDADCNLSLFFFFISDSDRHSLANTVSIKILKLSDLKDQVPPKM